MELPNKCPHCGKDIAYNSYVNFHNIKIFTCQHCFKYVIAIYDDNIEKVSELTGIEYCNDKASLICYFPFIPAVNISDELSNLSPDAIKIYKESLSNKALGFTTLSGAGIRIALDYLVWDYLIKIVGKSEDEIKSLTLNEKIKLMPISKETEICAHIIRIFGNNYIHPYKDFDCTLDEAIQLFEYIVDSLSKEIHRKKLLEKLAPKNVMPKTV